MPSTKHYQGLHEQVIGRSGAAERLAALRQQTLAEIGLYEMRRYLEWSQSGVAAELGISQAAVSQLENAQDVTISRLRRYLEPLGARLQILAVFENEGEEYGGFNWWSQHLVMKEVHDECCGGSGGDSCGAWPVVVAWSAVWSAA